MSTMKTETRQILVRRYADALTAMRDYVSDTMKGRNDGNQHATRWAGVEAAKQAIRDDISEDERRACWPNDAFQMVTRDV